LLACGVPAEKLWWTGVLPREGVKSAMTKNHGVNTGNHFCTSNIDTIKNW
jgi:hypothetical protein